MRPKGRRCPAAAGGEFLWECKKGVLNYVILRPVGAAACRRQCHAAARVEEPSPERCATGS
jgi:hypothetical protein